MRTLVGVPNSAPRIDPRLVAAIKRLDDRTRPFAEAVLDRLIERAPVRDPK